MADENNYTPLPNNDGYQDPYAGPTLQPPSTVPTTEHNSMKN